MNIPAQASASQRADASEARSWDFFDRIYCITLANRVDRQHQAREQFKRAGLLGRVEFVIVEKHPTNSERGIFESHMTCLRTGLAAGAQTIAVFEDDVLFQRFSPALLDRSIEFMKSNADWDIFFFGCFVYRSRRTAYRNVLRIRYQCTAHAYVVSRSFAMKIAEQSWRGIAYDDLLRTMTGERAYATYPSFAFQSGSSTDNGNLVGIDRIRRLLGGVRVLQRWNEFSSLRMRGLIVIHSLIVLVLIVTFIFTRSRHAIHHGQPVFFGN